MKKFLRKLWLKIIYGRNFKVWDNVLEHKPGLWYEPDVYISNNCELFFDGLMEYPVAAYKAKMNIIGRMQPQIAGRVILSEFNKQIITKNQLQKAFDNFNEQDII